jgi:Rrf2 family protein
MKVSNKADYALHAMLYIASVNGKRLCTIDGIAEAENIPREYLAKILKELTQKGFLNSVKGIHGGYRLARARSEVTFLDIIEAIEGPLALAFCNMSDQERTGSHKKGTCAATPFFDELRKKVMKDLSGMSLGKIDYDKYYPASAKANSKAKA